MFQRSNKRKIKDVRDITGCNEKTAKQVLRQFEYNVDSALDHFFSNMHDYQGVVNGASKSADLNKLNAIFDGFVDPDDPDKLYDAELKSYLEQISANPENSDALLVFWKLNASSIGELTRDEFMNGWKARGADSIQDMTRIVESARVEYSDVEQCYVFYKWLFNYLKEEKTHRTIPKEFGLAIWDVVISFFPLMNDLKEFLKQHETQVFTRDLWEQSYQFMKEMEYSLDSYDPNGAWPHFIDEFIQWKQKSAPPHDAK